MRWMLHNSYNVCPSRVSPMYNDTALHNNHQTKLSLSYSAVYICLHLFCVSLTLATRFLLGENKCCSFHYMQKQTMYLQCLNSNLKSLLMDIDISNVNPSIVYKFRLYVCDFLVLHFLQNMFPRTRKNSEFFSFSIEDLA
jgi:hypothetical protein